MAILSPDALLARVATLRGRVHAEGQAIFAAWEPNLGTRDFAPAARNLAHYLALREMDLSDVQASLAAYGLSSLGRSEGRVLATLDALHATLSRIAGTGEPPYPSARRFAEGRHGLAEAQRRLFGSDPTAPYTKIMVTLPSEAATDAVLVQDLIAAGMNCARINCAHDDAATWRAMARNVREAAPVAHPCTVLMDISGPKCRIEQVRAPERLRLHRGDQIVLARTMDDAQPDDAIAATINFPDIIPTLAAGAEVWINDGRIGARIAETNGSRVVLEILSAREKGERLRAEKGINFPGTELHLDPLTDKDLADLDTVAEIADMVGFSFVQRPADIARLHRELVLRRPGQPTMPLVLKIETVLAVQNLPRLIVQAGAIGPTAVMIARGDLAVELGFARMSEIQEEIMWLCEAAAVPVVWATQVLEGMVADALPTRAETTDAAMSQRAECVMLNKGKFIVEAVRFLADVLRRMDRHQSKKSARFGPLHSWPAGEMGL